jgi:hypothetical protein
LYAEPVLTGSLDLDVDDADDPRLADGGCCAH